MRRRRALLVGSICSILVVAAVAGGGYAVRQRPEKAAQSRGSLPTVTVVRGDLDQVQRLTGRLGYAGSRTLAGMGTGMITWLPSVGATVRRGGQLFRADDDPVVVFYGDMPLYRTLGTAAGEDTDTDAGRRHRGKQPAPPPMTGHDVDLVAENLAALGFWHGSTTDVSYSGYLVSAVAQWQRSMGEEATGVLELGRIAMARGPVRVSRVLAAVGDPEAQDVLGVTGTRRTITLDAPPSLADSLSPGRHLRVRLPDGSRIAARITGIGAETDNGDGPPSLPVTVEPRRQARLQTTEPGPVSARLVTASRKHVLHVPINALLALSGGGYALERPDHALVPVRIGMVADGRVEVSGIEAGAKVLVAG